MNRMEPIPANLHLRAILLADGFCRSEIEILGTDRGPGTYGLTDDDGQAVSDASEVQWRLKEAVSYLSARALATTEIDRAGLVVQLYLDRFTPDEH
jgi:hypothetical protein